MKIPRHLNKVREVNITSEELIKFEDEIKELYDDAQIKAPIHLSNGNESELIEIFSYISKEDWIFSSWRNHYHALLHGIRKNELLEEIVNGKSMSTNFKKHNFYSSSIVGGTIPIALGSSIALKKQHSNKKVWCFIGDMTFETGTFYEAHKYATNFDLPLQFIVEDNNMSTDTPTDETWGGVKREVPDNVIYYKYKRNYPHHGTGNWVMF